MTSDGTGDTSRAGQPVNLTQSPSPSGSAVGARLVIDGRALLVEGLIPNRRLRLFLEGVMGGAPTATGWLLEPKGRTLEELCIEVNRWLTSQGLAPELVGFVDVSIQRDQERIRSFTRARDAATAFRAGEPQMSREQFAALLAEAGWDNDARTLREHQANAAMHALSAANSANFSVPGAGKTATTLATAAAHYAAGLIEVVVVIGPLSSFTPWENETVICMPTWSTRRLVGTATERRRTIRSATPGIVLLSSYPGAVSDSAALRDLCRDRRVMLVADESHRIKRFNGGQWAPAVLEIAALASVRTVLSGTPMPQSGLDLYTQLNVMWPGHELTGTKTTFKPRVERRFNEVIDQILPFVSRTSKAELGLPPYTVEVVDVALSDAEAEIHGLLRNHLRRAVEAANPAEADRLNALRRGRPMRLLQAATNAGVLAEGRLVRASEGATPTLLDRIATFETSGATPAKFAAAAGILTAIDDGGKAVVWSNFVRNLDAFAAYCRANLDLAVFQVDGRVAARPAATALGGAGAASPAGGAEADRGGIDVSDDDESREAVIARFLSHQGKAVLITNPASCSESISLHSSCRNAIYLDRTYDCAQWLQSIDRIHRLGLPADAVVRVHVLRAIADGDPTADDLVAASLNGKEARMLQLLEGAALAPLGTDDDDGEPDLNDLRALLTYLLGRDQ